MNQVKFVTVQWGGEPQFVGRSISEKVLAGERESIDACGEAVTASKRQAIRATRVVRNMFTGFG